MQSQEAVGREDNLERMLKARELNLIEMIQVAEHLESKE